MIEVIMTENTKNWNCSGQHILLSEISDCSKTCLFAANTRDGFLMFFWRGYLFVSFEICLCIKKGRKRNLNHIMSDSLFFVVMEYVNISFFFFSRCLLSKNLEFLESGEIWLLAKIYSRSHYSLLFETFSMWLQQLGERC